MSSPPDQRLRREILVVQLVFTAVVAFAVGRQVLLAPTPPDFSTIWAAQQTAFPYDTGSITRILGSEGHLFWHQRSDQPGARPRRPGLPDPTGLPAGPLADPGAERARGRGLGAQPG